MFRLREGSICILSASCILSAITFDVQIEAETDCDVLLIPSAVFQSLMKNNIYVENFACLLYTSLIFHTKNPASDSHSSFWHEVIWYHMQDFSKVS